MRAVPGRLAAIAVMVAACSSPPNRSSIDAGGDGDGGESCTPFAARMCQGGDSYWVDSCGQVLEVAQECSTREPCNSIAELCCEPPQTGVVARLNVVGTVKWDFAEPGDRLSIDYKVLEEGSLYGLFFIAKLRLGADEFWIGTQYALSSGDPGLLVSRLSYGAGLGDIELASTTAYTESSPGDAGDYIGLRQPFVWEAGDYRIDLVRGDADSGSDWFDISIAVLATGETIEVGRIKAIRTTPMTTVTVPTGFTTELDLYGHAVDFGSPGAPPQRQGGDATYANIPTWAFELWYRVGARDPTQVETDYAVDDGGESFANLEMHMRTGSLFIGLGEDIGRCTADGKLL